MVKFYWSPEPLHFGDIVEFCVATRSYDGLVYAVDVAVLQRAEDMSFRVSQLFLFQTGQTPCMDCIR